MDKRSDIQSYKDLIVWQKSVELTLKIYELTLKFPPDEKFGIVSQMRRAAVSIASNIAEGRSRGTRKDFAQFLHIAMGSVAELETQLEISRQLKYGEKIAYTEVMVLLDEISKMLMSLATRLKAIS